MSFHLQIMRRGVKAKESASGGGSLVEIVVRRSEFRISVQPHT